MNDTMRRGKYHEEKFWNGMFGESVDNLWVKYKKTWEKPDEDTAPSVGKDSSGTGSGAETVGLEEEKNQVVMGQDRKPKPFVA